ncbi:nuclear transport factor 2 family protein [Novosphingobium pentaromativorans]|uniref:SnoaL-like domain-containing protein n=1 Tax=Novosphingobium pentaromativorans US6-1 TaxID=1088721 RepID=G6EGU8_9SPHN|nr:hypothetical protein [Novosphingobium pentaromativorans]EHJ59237.1 hypothetical protein NSU_3569 [Novosphingobium pentaromativorans US6-1]
MPHSLEEMQSIVREVFKRISSDGRESVAPSFTENGIYDFPYWPTYIMGSKYIGITFSDVIPKVLLRLKQWPIAIYPVIDGDTVMVEYASHATSAVDGSTYANRYAAVMKLVDGKIDFWREYFNPEWFMQATGSLFAQLGKQYVPAEAHRLQADDPSNVARWRSQWVLPEFENPPI